MIDFNSETWGEIKSILVQRHISLIQFLANPQVDWNATQFTRGQLAEIAGILAVENKQVELNTPEQQDYFNE